MKRHYPSVFILFALSVSAFLSASCGKDRATLADEHLAQAVDALSFPQELKDGSKLVSLAYSDKELGFRIEVSKEKYSRIAADSANFRNETIERLRTGLFPRNLIDNVVAAGASLRYVYVSGEDSVMYSVSTDELK